MDRWRKYVGPANRAKVTTEVRTHLFAALKDPDGLKIDGTGAGHVQIRTNLWAVVVPELTGGWAVVTFHRGEYRWANPWTKEGRPVDLVNDDRRVLIWANTLGEIAQLAFVSKEEAERAMSMYRATGQVILPDLRTRKDLVIRPALLAIANTERSAAYDQEKEALLGYWGPEDHQTKEEAAATTEYYPLCDDPGIIGYGFECPNCGAANDFVDERQSDHECTECQEIIELAPLLNR